MCMGCPMWKEAGQEVNTTAMYTDDKIPIPPNEVTKSKRSGLVECARLVHLWMSVLTCPTRNN